MISNKLFGLLLCTLVLTSCATQPTAQPIQIVEVTRIVTEPIVVQPTVEVATATTTATMEVPTPTATEEILFTTFNVYIKDAPGNRSSCADTSRQFVFTITAVRPITAILVMEQPDGNVIKKSHSFMTAGETWNYSRSLTIQKGNWIVGIRLWATEWSTNLLEDSRIINYGPWYNNMSGTFSCRG
jgi:hypothetical protein